MRLRSRPRPLEKADAYPLSMHLSGLGQHLVYGATVELVRGGMRQAI